MNLLLSSFSATSDQDRAVVLGLPTVALVELSRSVLGLPWLSVGLELVVGGLWAATLLSAKDWLLLLSACNVSSTFNSCDQMIGSLDHVIGSPVKHYGNC